MATPKNGKPRGRPATGRNETKNMLLRIKYEDYLKIKAIGSVEMLSLQLTINKLVRLGIEKYIELIDYERIMELTEFDNRWIEAEQARIKLEQENARPTFRL
jgi:hypothetical protein